MLSTKQRSLRRVPGEVGVWVLIFGEMSIFGMLFLTYLYYRNESPDIFEASQRSLDASSGALLTLVLLLASFLVVMAVRAIHCRSNRLAQRLVVGAMTCGLAFSALKVFEYHDKLQHQLTPQKNTFYLFYFALTGFHLFHLVIGLIVLTALYRLLRRPALSAGELRLVESGACYWHMVDLVWLIIFPLVYLVR